MIGSGGATADVPGFFVDQFTIQAVGGSITLNHVPIVAFDVAIRLTQGTSSTASWG